MQVELMTYAHIIFSLKRVITLYQSLLKLLLLREIYQHHLHKVTLFKGARNIWVSRCT